VRIRRKVLIAGLTTIAIAVAMVAVFFLSEPKPFDNWYDDADAQHADWKLVVEYSVVGLTEKREYEAHYRKRSAPRFQQTEWMVPDDGVFEEEVIEVLGGNWQYLSSFACGDGGGYSEHTNIRPVATEAGVNLAMHIQRLGGSTPYQAKATISLPFRLEKSGRQGNIEYQAKWHRISRPT
jgi:hypothetical protein